MTKTQFDGGFELAFLRNDESVRSAGKDSKAILIKGPTYEVRVELGEWVVREDDGSIRVVKA